MNKILFLKVLIAIITLLIFLTLGGIIYGLVNYKTTPKLLSRKNKVAVIQKTIDAPTEISLDMADKEKIKDSHACGNMLCIRIASDFNGERIIIVDPSNLQTKTILLKTKKTTGK